MLTRIEVKNYKLFRYISQPLDAFHILVGANATGKTTFLDVVSFVSDIVKFGLEEAVARRTNNFDDLTWQGKGENIEIALEFALPEEVREKLEIQQLDTIKYSLEFGIDNKKNELTSFHEHVTMFSKKLIAFEDLVTDNGKKIDIYRYNKKSLIKNKNDTKTHFLPEIKAEAHYTDFTISSKYSSLANLPSDEVNFPASFWLRELLTQGIQKFMLDSEVLRKASPPNQGKTLKANGGNLPWVLEDLKKNHAKLFKRWLAHIRTSLPDVKDVKIIRRKDDAHKYFKIVYENGAEVPSWLVSDGTLRMLTLTLLAYLPDFKGIYLIEEPENGIHPKAMETIFQSLSSIYEAQVLVASHSTAFLSVAEPQQLLCFAKDEAGEAHIIKGNEHPRLQQWKGETNLSILFAGGVLE